MTTKNKKCACKKGYICNPCWRKPADERTMHLGDLMPSWS